MKTQSNGADYYNALSRWGKALDEANRQRVEQTLMLVPADIYTVLDLGCGDGTVSNSLVASGLDVTGTDISSKALQYFKGKGIIAILGQLPFSNHSFDLLICAEVLEHIPVGVYERTLKEIERIARQYIIITTPDNEYLPAGFVKCKYCGCIYHMNLHVRVFNRKAHRTLFQDFKLVKTVGINSWKHYPVITSLEQRLLGIYRFKEGLICPCCGYNSVEKPTLGLWEKGFLKGIRLLGRFIPQYSNARWIASLYSRRQ